MGGIEKNLFRSQTFCRIGHRCADCLKAHGNQGNDHGEHDHHYKNTNTDINFVLIPFQPFVHEIPGDGYGNHAGN